ncbi:MAG: hypothetical protein ACKOTB_12965, partial [Planctomycetia bacterium]
CESAVPAPTVLVPGLGPAAPPSLSATEPAARDVAVDVGFAGVFRTGSWTPVTVTFPSASAAAETGGIRGRPENTVRRALPPPMPSSESVFLSLGDLPAAERASRLLSREDGSRPRVVTWKADAVADGSLPGPDALGYDGIDTIILAGRVAAVLDPRAARGIDAWVRQGGQLVVLSGTTAVALSRAENGAAAWLPGEVARTVPVRRANAIETYARASRPLEKAAVAGLQVPLFRQPQEISGSVETFEGRGPGDLPLVVRRAHGLGTIVWAGMDLDGPPFTNWSGSESFLVEMIRGRRAAREAGRSGETLRGSLDLAGQLRQTIDRFAGVSPIPFEVIAGLGALYVACLYPLDWWLVSGRRRAGPSARRSWLAWVSLPLLVVAASGVAWSAGERWKGRAWRTNAAEMVDIDVQSGLLRVVAFLGVWSPENATLEIAAEPVRLGQKRGAAAVTWFAPAGRGIGATDAAAPHPSLAARDYGYADSLGRFEGVPIAASSSRLFEGEIVSELADAAVSSTLVKEGQGTLRGSVVSHLPFPLEDCMLMHAGWVYDVGVLGPGASFDPASTRGPRSLAGALTRRTMNKDREVAARWDLAERDPSRILEIAGFHAAAGGSGYTSLESGRLARLDLSPLLPLDRAVLVGRGPAAVHWACRVNASEGGTDQGEPPAPARVSLWRIVIPLDPQAETARASASPRPSPAAAIEAVRP